MRFVSGEDLPKEDVLNVIVPWLHAASEPYLSWLVNDQELALEILLDFTHRPSSEYAYRRANMLMLDGEIVGGYIALAGEELMRCRRADLAALMRYDNRMDLGALRSRMRQANSVFLSVTSDEFYLSKLGVIHVERGRGLGRAVAMEFMRHARNNGWRRLCLDVWSQNHAAIRLYRSLGFYAVNEVLNSEMGCSYFRMATDL